MRAVVIQVTGLADVASPDLGGKTPLEAASTPVLDELASRGILGLMRTIPEGAAPTVCLATGSILGVDFAGEVPAPGAVAAAGAGVAVPPGMRAACLDLIAVGEQETGGPAVMETRFPELGDEDAVRLAEALDEAVSSGGARVHAGWGGNHVLVFPEAEALALAAPPDAMLGRPLAEALPPEESSGALRALMSRARVVLWDHPACTRLREGGVPAPSDVWPWGAGAGCTLPAFVDHFGVRGAAVAVTPLTRGMARLCGLDVEPAAGGGASLAERVERALALGAEYEFVLLTVETVDHVRPRGGAVAKTEAVSRLDAEVLAPMVEGLRAAGGDWRLAVVADVTSSCTARCYTADPVPFVVATPRDAGRASAPRRRFTEREAREQGIFLGDAHGLLERLLRR
ncbi:MAG TPA: hypothetical protein VNO26_15155 [Candidatus Limnocylindria bacterium]|nr:hypothetical protein [Candidatus Limnocylindria bacterium]